ncbi:MAG: hypothetical protein RLY64_546 [Bacteroidota bacterium]|jgi:hypothetical protein
MLCVWGTDDFLIVEEEVGDWVRKWRIEFFDEA